jgi:hypothetical protein
MPPPSLPPNLGLSLMESGSALLVQVGRMSKKHPQGTAEWFQSSGAPRDGPCCQSPGSLH